MVTCYSSSGKLIGFLFLLSPTAISTAHHELFTCSLVSPLRIWVQGVYLFWALMFPRAQKNVQQSMKKNILNYEWIWAAQVTSCVFLFGSNSLGGLWILLLLFLLYSMPGLAKNMLLLTFTYISLWLGYYRKQEFFRNHLEFHLFWDVAFMKYNCDSLFQLSWI